MKPAAGRWGMALAAVAALLSLTAAGGSTARPARGTATDTVLVRLNGGVISTGMLQRRIEELPEHLRPQFTTPEGRQRLLDRIVEEEVWLQTAKRAGVASRPEVLRQIEQQRRDLLIRTYVNEMMAGNPAPADSELQAYYDQHLSEYKTPASASVSHIQLASEAEARKVRQWLRSGQDWNKLVARYSTDTLTAKRGGSLGSVSREGVFAGLGKQQALADSVFALASGAFGGPIKTDRGWHVIRVDALTPEGTRGFDQVRTVISRQLGAKRSQDFYQSHLAQSKVALGMNADSTAIHKFLALKRSPREMFTDAQSAGTPAARIAAYRELLKEYPDSDVSPQAAFMIGFIQSEELKTYDDADKSFHDLLAKFPKSELTASARWMIEHMRNQNAPEFMNLETDSTAVDTTTRTTHPAAPAGKPVRSGTRKP